MIGLTLPRECRRGDYTDKLQYFDWMRSAIITQVLTSPGGHLLHNVPHKPDFTPFAI
jgi:hypothetical protein